jgi:hypothetical protein
MESKRFFTYKQCNQALILVKPIVKDIIEKRTTMLELKQQNVLVQSREMQMQISNIAKAIMHHLNELEQVGCYLRDFTTGHIQFPCTVGTQIGYYNWKVGEDTVFIQKAFVKNLFSLDLVQ